VGVDVDRYLERIGYGGWARPDLLTLAALQRAHLTAVPFENLDVYYRRGVEVGVDWALDKVLDRERGGWCFELNTAFAELLRAIGFEVGIRAAEVMWGRPAPESPDHMTIEVLIEGRSWLVDVGFGDAMCRPLALDVEDAQDGESRPYRIRHDDEGFVVLEAPREGGLVGADTTDHEWVPQYRFLRTEVDLSVFEPASHRLQHTEGLHWTQTRFATRLFPGGRVTLLHDRLKLTRDTGVDEVPVDEDRWHGELEAWFGIGGFNQVER
jgi:N-hydroxyarylamine O-acetyltransferase